MVQSLFTYMSGPTHAFACMHGGFFLHFFKWSLFYFFYFTLFPFNFIAITRGLTSPLCNSFGQVTGTLYGDIRGLLDHQCPTFLQSSQTSTCCAWLTAFLAVTARKWLLWKQKWWNHHLLASLVTEDLGEQKYLHLLCVRPPWPFTAGGTEGGTVKVGAAWITFTR